MANSFGTSRKTESHKKYFLIKYNQLNINWQLWGSNTISVVLLQFELLQFWADFFRVFVSQRPRFLFKHFKLFPQLQTSHFFLPISKQFLHPALTSCQLSSITSSSNHIPGIFKNSSHFFTHLSAPATLNFLLNANSAVNFSQNTQTLKASNTSGSVAKCQNILTSRNKSMQK